MSPAVHSALAEASLTELVGLAYEDLFAQDKATALIAEGPRRSGRFRCGQDIVQLWVARVAAVNIEPATAQDWPRIWPVFRDIVASGETYALPEDLTSDTARSLWMERAPGQTVIAVNSGKVLGSAKMGPIRPGRGAHIATASFMVDQGSQGQGVGRSLGSYALHWARASGYRSMQFNAVVETNTAAVRLWQALGFRILTTVPEAFDHPQHGFVGLHVMFQRL